MRTPTTESTPSLPPSILRIQYGQDLHARGRMTKHTLFEAVRYARVDSLIAHCFGDIRDTKGNGIHFLVAFDRLNTQNWRSWTALIFPADREALLEYEFRTENPYDSMPGSTHLPLRLRSRDLPDWMDPSSWRLIDPKPPIRICEDIGNPWRSRRKHLYVFYDRQPANLWAEGPRPRNL